jgi:hypothetical protein
VFLEFSRKRMNVHKNLRTFNGAAPVDGGAGASKLAKTTQM